MVSPADVLFIPRPARLLHERDGQVLTLFYDEKEITFDDPALIPFGERLLRENRFVAEQALAWCANGYEWETVKEVCEALLSEGLLAVEDKGGPTAETPIDRAERIEGNGTTTNARAWTPDACAALSKQIYGVPVESGNLESLVRCVRIAHSALDVGGRQIGEKNVFPPALSLALPTTVRTCPYRGSRFEHELPMNVTGLEPVIKHWRDVLHDVQVLKQEFWRRTPRAADGFTVVDLYLLGTIALTFPAYLMHRAKAPVENGHLPSAISAFFRVMDGTRIAPRHMLLNPHPSFGSDEIPSAQRLHHYADREGLMIAGAGVCAGPPQMIETFLQVVTAPESGERIGPRPGSLVQNIEAAFAYGLAAAEIEAFADLFWIRQRAIVDRLLQSDLAPALRLRLEASLEDDDLGAYSFLPPESDRAVVDAHFARVVRQCQEMSGRPGDVPAFEDDPDPVVALRRLEEQILPRMAERQAECNAVLGRAPPVYPWSGCDVAAVWPRASLRAALEENGIAV